MIWFHIRIELMIRILLYVELTQLISNWLSMPTFSSLNTISFLFTAHQIMKGFIRLHWYDHTLGVHMYLVMVDVFSGLVIHITLPRYLVLIDYLFSPSNFVFMDWIISTIDTTCIYCIYFLVEVLVLGVHVRFLYPRILFRG